MVAVSATVTEINRFDSPAQELSRIFRRGGNSTFQCGINYRTRRPVPYERAAAATSTSTVNRNRIFWTKEVILLPGVAENEVVRGLRKSDLMGQRFIRSELEINKCWGEVEIIEFQGKQLEEKVIQIIFFPFLLILLDCAIIILQEQSSACNPQVINK